MRIPSNNKIKKQAENYANEWYKPCLSLLKELEALEIKQNKLSKQWNRIRDDFCNGEPCICVTHPRHKEFSDDLEPLNSRISTIYRQIAYEKKALMNQKERLLLQAREAKNKFRK